MSTATATRPTRAKAAGTGETPWDDARKFYAPKFPSTAELKAVTATLKASHGLPTWEGGEGSRARVAIAAGAVAIGYRNLARRHYTIERAEARHRVEAHRLAIIFEETGQFPDDPPGRSSILSWSRKSRANMWRATHEIDYEPFFRRGQVPAMVTLTYPGAYEVVAPGGAECKRHLWVLRRRYLRTWGEPLRAIWKQEFQMRGAPHFHLMMVPPHGRAPAGRYAGMIFKKWLSHTWAEIVDHPDPDERERHLRAGTNVNFAEGLKAMDPRRVAVYFAKHGSFRAKEYQHNVPDAWKEPGHGPGRFWGYWSLQRPVHGVELDHGQAVTVARTLRRWAHAQGVSYQVAAPRYPGGLLRPAGAEVVGLTGARELAAQPPAATRRVRRRTRRMRGRYGAGWVSTNDGAAMARDITRVLSLPRGSPPDEIDRPAPGFCRACGELRSRHRCPAWETSRKDRAWRKFLRRLASELGHEATAPH
jgi:hypothetical protein